MDVIAKNCAASGAVRTRVSAGAKARSRPDGLPSYGARGRQHTNRCLARGTADMGLRTFAGAFRRLLAR
jgi:hypothetical protein